MGGRIDDTRERGAVETKLNSKRTGVRALGAWGGAVVTPGTSFGALELVRTATFVGLLRIEPNGLGQSGSDMLNVGQSLDITGAPLQYALVAARLHDPADVLARHDELVGIFDANTSAPPPGYAIDFVFDDGTGANHVPLSLCQSCP